MPKEKRNEIQWLRALAAFEVIICHSDLIVKHFSNSRVLSATWYAPVAGVGVELFFIISGYIMAMRVPAFRDYKAFLASRIIRIYPLYWVFTTIVVVIGLVMPAWRLGAFDMSVMNLARSYLILPGDDYPILGVGWTLEYEMVFYAFVALLMFLGVVRGDRLTAVAWILAGFGVIGCAYEPSTWGGAPLSHVFTPYMFAFGVGWLFRCLEPAQWRRQAGALLLFGMIAGLGFWLGSDQADRLILTTLLAAVVFGGTLAVRGVFQADNAVNRLVWLAGDASYSIYLSHWFILSAAGKAFGILALPAELAPAVRIVGALICVAAGIAIFYTIESFLARWLRNGAPVFMRIGRVERPALR
ncbi:acyltransferase family protein [Dankookia sp. GCM10030260]|uniref:acyltransferase family protein n=1 Tax=Dankookia sp. GCM10030260 TaxID=3273390 RepID=UPI0036235992